MPRIIAWWFHGYLCPACAARLYGECYRVADWEEQDPSSVSEKYGNLVPVLEDVWELDPRTVARCRGCCRPI